MNPARPIWQSCVSLGLIAIGGQLWCVPATAQPSDPTAAVADEDLSQPVAVVPSAAAHAVMQLPRQSPADYFRAAINLYDLGEKDLAGDVLGELVALDVAPAARSDLVQQFGSYRMLQIAQDPLLSPALQAFTNSCLEAAATQGRDPARLEALVAQLGNPSPRIRHAALVDLGDAGIDGVRYVAKALAREQNPARRRHLWQTLASVPPLSIRPLLAMLSTDQPQLKADVIRALADLEVPQAIPLLAVPALLSEPDSPTSLAAHSAFFRLSGQQFSLPIAEQQLLRAMGRRQDGVIPFAPDADGQIECWFWNDETGDFVVEHYPSDEVCVIWAARLAEDLYRLSPAREDHRVLAVMLGLEATKTRQGYQTSLADLSLDSWLADASVLSAADPNELSRLLDACLDNRYAGAAAAVCEMLGKPEYEFALATYDAQPSSLVRALSNPDRRVRFAALKAISAMDPRSPYPGSSQVPMALGRFARSTTQRMALVAVPQLAEATTIGGLMSGLGITTSVAGTGRELIEIAREQSGAEFVLVDVRIGRPGIREVIYELRSAAVTSGTPIGLLAQAGDLPVAQRIAGQHQGVVAFYRPHSAEAASAIADRMVRTAGRSFLPATERAEQATFAMDELARLLTERRTFYRLRPQVATLDDGLYQPAQSAYAIRGLALLGSPESQRTLVDYASRPAAPLESRELAAEAFRHSVAEHGILLTSQEIFRQYDRYNTSAAADAGTQQVLSQVLDVLESRRRGD